MPKTIAKTKTFKLQNKPPNYHHVEIIQFQEDKFVLDYRNELWDGGCLPFSSLENAKNYIKKHILNGNETLLY